MTTEIFIPKMGANIDKVIVGKIHVKKGDQVGKGDILFEIVTDKATFEVEADASGTIVQFDCEEGEELNVLKVIGFIEDKSETLTEVQKKLIKATPRAKKLAKDNNINLETVFFGTKKIVKEEDISEMIKSDKLKVDYLLVELSPRKIAEITALNQTRNYLYSSVTMQVSTAKIKQKVAKIAQQDDIRLSISQYISYCSVSAVLDFPDVNACYSDEGIKQYQNVNLGIAMNLGSGLVVPVIKSANKLKIVDFLNKYSEIILRIMRNEVTSGDFRDGTFTITDLSSYQVLDFIPVINKDQSSILAISSEYDSCKYEKGKLIYDPKMNLTLAFDHRVMDGKYALEFLNKLIKEIT